MRSGSVLLVTLALLTGSGCLLLHRPGAEEPGGHGAESSDDSDLPGTDDGGAEDTDPTDTRPDDSDQADSDATESGATDSDVSDTDTQDSDQADTDVAADTDDTDLVISDTDPHPAETDSAGSAIDTAAGADTDTPGGGNLPPTVSAPSINPTPVYNTDSVTCAATVSDPDGTTPTVTFAWRNLTRATSLGGGPGKLLSALIASPGDSVECAVTASDGRLSATQRVSVVVGNRAPTLLAPSISPSPAHVTSTLTCSALASDPDGTSPSVTYAWTNLARASSLGVGPSTPLSASVVSVGESVRCEATASDGALTSSRTVSAPVDASPGVLGAWKTIPAGSFTMGCTPGRDDVATAVCAGSDAVPAHSVTLSRPFWMMEAEVTQAQWQAAFSNNPSSYTACGASCPVERVTWYEAAAFANVTSVTEGLPACYTLLGCTGSPGASLKCTGVTVATASGSPYDCEGYRLPTEAEWEYAARGGESSAYAGGGVVDDVAWYSVNAARTTHPACSKAANAYGLCDMSGNVSEWAWDEYATYPSAAQTDPTGGAGSLRMQRGGYFNVAAEYTRAAYRFYAAPGGMYGYVGFRLVRTVK